MLFISITGNITHKKQKLCILGDFPITYMEGNFLTVAMILIKIKVI